LSAALIGRKNYNKILPMAAIVTKNEDDRSPNIVST
jgi:hypothetical protein